MTNWIAIDYDISQIDRHSTKCWANTICPPQTLAHPLAPKNITHGNKEIWIYIEIQVVYLLLPNIFDRLPLDRIEYQMWYHLVNWLSTTFCWLISFSLDSFCLSVCDNRAHIHQRRMQSITMPYFPPAQFSTIPTPWNGLRADAIFGWCLLNIYSGRLFTLSVFLFIKLHSDFYINIIYFCPFVCLHLHQYRIEWGMWYVVCIIIGWRLYYISFLSFALPCVYTHLQLHTFPI